MAIGFYLKEQANTGEDFFLAGREMTAWVAGLSFLAANLGSLELMGWAGTAYQYGILATHWYWIGAIPAMLFLGTRDDAVLLHFARRTRCPAICKLRFGEPARALSADLVRLHDRLMSGINMYSMALVMKVVLGWDIHFSIWVSSLTVAVYVALGGLRLGDLQRGAAVRADLAGRPADPDPRPDRSRRLERHGANADPTQLRRGQDYTHAVAHAGRLHATIRWASTGSGIVFGLGCVISFGYWTTDFLVVQRVLAAKDLRSAKLAPIIGAAFKMMVPFIVILPGLLGLAVLRDPHGN